MQEFITEPTERSQKIPRAQCAVPPVEVIPELEPELAPELELELEPEPVDSSDLNLPVIIVRSTSFLAR